MKANIFFGKKEEPGVNSSAICFLFRHFSPFPLPVAAIEARMTPLVRRRTTIGPNWLVAVSVQPISVEYESKSEGFPSWRGPKFVSAHNPGPAMTEERKGAGAVAEKKKEKRKKEKKIKQR